MLLQLSEKQEGPLRPQASQPLFQGRSVPGKVIEQLVLDFTSKQAEENKPLWSSQHEFTLAMTLLLLQMKHTT